MRRLLILISGLSLCFMLATIGRAEPADAQEKNITEEKILALIKTADRAIARRDVAGVAALLADDAIVTLKNIPGPQGQQTLSFTKGQYASYLEASWRLISLHKYDRQDVRIDVAASGDIATVHDRVSEYTTLQDGTVITSTLEEESILEIQSGRVVIISVDAVILNFDVVSSAPQPASGDSARRF